MPITKHDVAAIADLIEQGLSPDEIADELNEIEAEDRAHREEYHAAYGDDYNDADDRSYRDKFISDRLDMGQNDAGEWLGFC
jgi:hypothetical protein